MHLSSRLLPLAAYVATKNVSGCSSSKTCSQMVPLSIVIMLVANLVPSVIDIVWHRDRLLAATAAAREMLHFGARSCKCDAMLMTLSNQSVLTRSVQAKATASTCSVSSRVLHDAEFKRFGLGCGSRAGRL